MAKDGVTGSSFAPGAFTVAVLHLARDQESRTARFGPPHLRAADPTTVVWEPADHAWMWIVSVMMASDQALLSLPCAAGFRCFSLHH